MTTETQRVMVGVKEIMGKMGIGRDAAYDIIRSSDIPTVRVGRRYLIHEETFDKWLKGELKGRRKF